MRLHNRMIKANFWTDTDLLRHLDRDGRMFYIGLTQLADDSGCLEDDLLAFKIHLYPADMDVDLDFIQKYRDKLVEMKKLIPYVSEGKKCLYMQNFHKHQSLRSPAPPSVPLPDWITWEPGQTARSSGKYIVDESYCDRTATVRTPYNDQLEPEPEEKRTRRGKELKDSPDCCPDDRQGPQQLSDAPRVEPEEPPKEELKHTEDSMAFKAASYLRGRILANNPRARVPTESVEDKLMQAWATELDRLHRLGPPGGEQGYNWQEIRQLIDFSQDDEFWRANILSAGKLREKCVQLENQMKRNTAKARGHPTMSRNVANALRLVEKYDSKGGGYP